MRVYPRLFIKCWTSAATSRRSGATRLSYLSASTPAASASFIAEFARPFLCQITSKDLLPAQMQRAELHLILFGCVAMASHDTHLLGKILFHGLSVYAAFWSESYRCYQPCQQPMRMTGGLIAVLVSPEGMHLTAQAAPRHYVHEQCCHRRSSCFWLAPLPARTAPRPILGRCLQGTRGLSCCGRAWGADTAAPGRLPPSCSLPCAATQKNRCRSCCLLA